MKIIILLLSTLSVYTAISQTPEISAIKKHLKTSKDDTNKVINYLQFSKMLYNTSAYVESLENANYAKTLSEKLGYKSGVASSLYCISIVYLYQGKYPESIKIQNETIKIREELGEKRNIAASYVILSQINGLQKNYQESIKNNQIALKILEELSDKQGVAAC